MSWLVDEVIGGSKKWAVWNEDGGEIVTTDSEQDARLIAAAPDLLEIVRDLVSDCKGSVNPQFYELAVAALAKAGVA